MLHYLLIVKYCNYSPFLSVKAISSLMKSKSRILNENRFSSIKSIKKLFMKIFKLYILTSGLLIALNANAQKSPESLNGSQASKFSIHAGAGVALIFFVNA